MPVLLSILGIIITAAAGFVSLIVVLGLSYAGIIADILFMILIAFFMEKVRKDVLERKSINEKTFIACTEGVPVVISAVLFATMIYLDKTGYWHGQFFGGMFEILLSASAFGSSVVILISHIIIITMKKSGN